MRRLLVVAALAVLVGCGANQVSQTMPVEVTSAAPASSSGFSANLNAFRASQGLGGMRSNAALSRAAQAHAEDMARRGYFSHESPGGPNGDTFVDRAQAGGCAMRSGAENIADGQTSEQAVLVAWQNSPGHRRNMLVRSYTQYGLGRSGNTWVLKLAANC